MNKMIGHSVIAVAVLAAMSPTAHAVNLCVGKGITVGFFNGVWNTQLQAGQGLAELRRLVGEDYQGEPIQYEVFYNQTGSENSASMAQDIAEVFIQRSVEIDSSGELGKRWEYAWEIATGSQSLWDKLLNLFPAAGSLLTQMKNELVAKTTAAVADLLSNPPTEADYQSHNTRLDALATQQQKLLLVAHSQGNLFMNHGYDHIKPTVTEKGVRAVHIAPASPTLRGNYVLADIDLVINGLRVQGLDTVPPVNLTLPTSTADMSGHTLVGTYLDSSRDGRRATESLISGVLPLLETPTTGGNEGAFTATLTWTGPGDVDLHTNEPSGAHVFYRNTAGVSGFLDVDNTTGYGPEHYYATCDSDALNEGTYSIGINNYNAVNGGVATVQIATSKGGVIGTKTEVVGPVMGDAGNNSPVQMLDVVVSKDENGAVSFKVQ